MKNCVEKMYNNLSKNYQIAYKKFTNMNQPTTTTPYEVIETNTKETPTTFDENIKPDEKLNKCRRIRTYFTKSQLLDLEREFSRNIYLHPARRIEIATRLNLTEKQVKVWFVNRRSKHKKLEKDENRTVNYQTYSPNLTKSIDSIPKASENSSKINTQCMKNALPVIKPFEVKVVKSPLKIKSQQIDIKATTRQFKPQVLVQLPANIHVPSQNMTQPHQQTPQMPVNVYQTKPLIQHVEIISLPTTYQQQVNPQNYQTFIQMDQSTCQNLQQQQTISFWEPQVPHQYESQQIIQSAGNQTYQQGVQIQQPLAENAFHQSNHNQPQFQLQTTQEFTVNLEDFLQQPKVQEILQVPQIPLYQEHQMKPPTKSKDHFELDSDEFCNQILSMEGMLDQSKNSDFEISLNDTAVEEILKNDISDIDIDLLLNFPNTTPIIEPNQPVAPATPISVNLSFENITEPKMTFSF